MTTSRSMRRRTMTAFSTLSCLGALLLCSSAWAESATLTLQDEAAENGASAMLGPNVGLYGPPTSFSFQLQFWHVFDERWGFVSVAGMDVSGETTLDSGDDQSDDATYPSTVGGRVFAGFRYVFEVLDWPVETYTRAGALVTVTGGSEIIGYSVGTAGAVGLSYGVSPEVELVTESEFGLGLGQYRASGVVPAATWSLLLGAQMRF